MANDTSPFAFTCFVSLLDPVSKFLNGPVTFTLAMLGCVGNVYSIGIMRKLTLFSKALRIYLVTMAIWDCVVLLCALGYYGFFAMSQCLLPITVLHQPLWAYLIFTFHALRNASITGSAWMTVIVATARYLAVSRPLHIRASQTTRRARMIAAISTIVAVLYNIPCFFELRMVPCQSKVTDQPSLQIHAAVGSFTNKKIYNVLYRTIGYILFVSVGPFVLTLLFSVHMTVLLNRRESTDMQHSQQVQVLNATTTGKRRTRRKRTGVLLVILLTKYLFSHVLPTALIIAGTIVDERTLYSNRYYTRLLEISGLLIVLNSATNFLVYTLWRNRIIKSKNVPTKPCNVDVQQQSTTVSGNVFSAEEIEILKRTWHQSSNRLPAVIDEVLEQIALQNCSLQELIEREKNVLSARIFDFMDSIINEMQVGSFPCERLQHVGRIHRENAVRISNSSLLQFKKGLLSELATKRRQSLVVGLFAAPKESNNKVLHVWSRFLCVLIAEMKLGYYLCQSHSLSDSSTSPRKSSSSKKSTIIIIDPCSTSRSIF